MTKLCSCTGCTKQVLGRWSRYCPAHEKANRRHGDPTQRGITAAEIEPFVKRVEHCRRFNPSNQTWEVMQARWNVVATHAKEYLQEYRRGDAKPKHSVEAMKMIGAVADSVDAWAVPGCS
jgi:hypothetical protein